MKPKKVGRFNSCHHRRSIKENSGIQSESNQFGYVDVGGNPMWLHLNDDIIISHGIFLLKDSDHLIY